MLLQVAIIVVLVLVGLLVALRRGKSHVLPPGVSLPPSPPGHFFLKNVPMFNGPHQELMQAHDQLGPMVRMDLIGFEAVSVADIDDQAKILQHSEQLGNLPLIRLSFGRVFPHIMAFLDGDDWKRIRRVSQHALNIHKLSPLVHIAVDSTYDMFDIIDSQVQWVDGRTTTSVDLRSMFAKVLFDAFSRFGFGYNWNVLKGDNADVMELLHDVWKDMLAWTALPFDFLRRIPTPHNNSLYFRADKIRDLARMVIEQKKQAMAGDNQTEPDDLLSALLFAKDSDGNSLNEIEVIENIIGFFFGSYETTVNLLCFMCNQLSLNLDVQERVYEDIKQTLGDTDRFTWELLNKAEYLTNMTKETLRIQPQVNQNLRYSLEDMTVGKFFIPKHSMLLLQNYIPSHDPKIWGVDVDQFKPERWETMDPVLARRAWSPFGLGSRMCIGQKVALAESRAIMATILKNYKILPDPKKPPVISMTLQTVCHEGCWILERRNQ